MPEGNPIRSTRDFVVLSNLNAVGASTATPVNANNFSVQFNNTNFTNVQANAGDGTIVKMYPQLCSLDLNYFNISAVFQNNKFSVAGAALANSPVLITIPDGIYNIVNFVSTIAGLLNTNCNFTGEDAANYTTWFDSTAGSPSPFASTGNLNLFYKAYGTPTLSDLTFTFVGTSGGVDYNSRKLFGSSSAAIILFAPAVVVTGKFGSYTFPYPCDLQTYNIIRVHANIARRTYKMSGGSAVAPVSQGALNQSDIFFEMPLSSDNSVGTTLVFQPNDPFAFEQVVDSNFDTLRIQLRDIYGDLIPLSPTAEFNLTLGVTRDVPEQTNAQKIANLSTFQHFNST
jgi:hypothetical protein